MQRHAGPDASWGAMVAVMVALAAAAWCPPVRAQAPETGSVEDMFGVLRTAHAVSLPASAARTVAALRRRAPGKDMALDVRQARRIGPRSSALYLVPAPEGLCAVPGDRGACSNTLDALSRHGLRFWIRHPPEHRGDPVDVDLYGALPDGLTAVTVGPLWDTPRTTIGTNAHHNGFAMRLHGQISQMILTGPRGAATLGPLGRSR